MGAVRSHQQVHLRLGAVRQGHEYGVGLVVDLVNRRPEPDGAPSESLGEHTRKLGRTAGVEVVQVVEGGPAERAGMRPEDLIVELDGTPIEGMDELQRVVVSELIGRAVRAKVVREGREQELELVPAELDG